MYDDHYAIRKGVNCAALQRIFDMRGVELEKLLDVVLLQTLLSHSAKACGARLRRTDVTKKEEGGLVGFMTADQGHIAIHTFPEHQEVLIDILMGASSSVLGAEKLIREYFGGKRVRPKDLLRGGGKKTGQLDLFEDTKKAA